MYLRKLENRHTGFAAIKSRQIIDHLLNTYGNLTQMDLATNDAFFHTIYDPSQPIESIYMQMEDAMDLAAAGLTPYTPAQVIANIRSTSKANSPTADPVPDTPPSSHNRLTDHTHHVYVAIHDLSSQIYTDLTGPFPVTSSCGHKYILVLYDYDSNAILMEPMRNRSDTDHLRAYNKLHQYLLDQGFRPHLQKVDNEASTALKRTIRAKGIDYQLVPPHTHCCNAAE
jgi:hypothetical protein